jgi:DUF3048 family protein
MYSKVLMLKRVLFLLCVICLLAACDLAETPAPVATRRPTRTPAPIPTDLPVPTPTVIPSPTPDPVVEQCPLTGLRDPAKPWLTRRPLAVKIDNSPLARPQAGLMGADVIFEHLAEGGVTRFDAVYWCGDADPIGPVRSARIIDLDLVQMLQAILVHVGASNENLAALQEKFGNRLMDENLFKAPFHRTTDRVAPYNTYTSTQGLWAVAPGHGAAQQGIQLKGLVFRDAAPEGGKPANKVTVPYDSRFSDSVWEYVPERKKYSKFLLGEPLVSDNQRVQAENVIVLFTPHTVTDIIEDSLGSRSIAMDLRGRGRAVIFRDGQAFEAQWLRDDPNAMIRFVDANNKDIALKNGRSWIEIVPTDLKLEWK